ncbi:LOW QUALITY PROTEIN: coiled-coil domain-containing protein 185 [Anomaloglossus baeobatrachus]|uniref:LOW QUALITY PROTEIN: coiled-coil domain-containing protein 185 n=1 Tax=Anomaloglossus baeobatrachus TaxID=238106 RepID=UPI003F5064B2
MEGGRRSPALHLDLTNFEDGGDSRYVLTSPRSLEACARLGVRPVDLLYKSYGEVREEKPGASSQEVSEMYEAQEMERLRKVRQCRELRKSLLQNDGNQEQLQSSMAPQEHRDPSPLNHGDPTPPNTQRYKESAGRNHRDPSSQNYRDPTTSNAQNYEDPTGHNLWDHRDPSPLNHGDPTPRIHSYIDPAGRNPPNHRGPSSWNYGDPTTSNTRSYKDPTGQNLRDPSFRNHGDPATSNTENYKDSVGQNPRNHRDHTNENHEDTKSQNYRDHQGHIFHSHKDHKTQNPWNPQDNRTQKPWDHRDTTTSPDHWDYLEVTASPNHRDPYTLASSPSRWNPYHLAISPNHLYPYNFATSPNPTSSGHKGGGAMRKSQSHGNLVSQEEQIRHLTRKVEKEVQVSVPYRDKKIAALMLLRHQEEEMSKQRRLQAQRAWDELRSKEMVIRGALSKRDWTDRPQNLRRSPRSSKHEWQLDAVRYLTAQNNKEWKTLTHEEKILLKDGMKKVREDLQSKRQLQELKEKDTRETGGLLEERMLQAFKAKMIKDLQDKRNLQIKNEYEKLRHSRLKKVADNQVKAEELSKRMSMRQKERRFQDVYEQIQEERLKEIHDKASREEAMNVMVKLRAERQEKEQINHKKLLLQISNQKTLQAKDILGKSLQSKAERTREVNIVKEKAHQILKQKVEEDEENYRKNIAHLIRVKDRKSDKLLKEKEATIEEGKKIARASFHMRDQIREQTRSRTFDQMALQAQLSASFMKSLP